MVSYISKFIYTYNILSFNVSVFMTILPLAVCRVVCCANGRRGRLREKETKRERERERKDLVFRGLPIVTCDDSISNSNSIT